MEKPRKFESTSQPGLFFWAQDADPEGILEGPQCFMVVSQADGFPATEAHDDWFAHEADAVRVAEQLANGTLEQLYANPK